MIVRQFRDGEHLMAEHKQQRIRDEDLFWVVATNAYAMKLVGWRTPQIAKMFNVTRQQVNRRIARLSERARQQVARNVRNGTINVGRPPAG